MKNSRSPWSPILCTLPPFICLLVLCGCSGSRPLHGGRALTTTAPSGLLTQTLTQPENPATPSRQTQDTIRVRTYALPSDRSADFSPQRSTSAASTPSLQYSTTPILLSEREEQHATTELGAAQKDTARELGAKLSSLKSIVWVGLGLFLLGLASLFWPPLKAVVASTTTSAAMTIGGLALMVLPTLIVGHELLILGAVVAFVAAWFLAHRHGHLRGQLAAHTVRSADFSPQPLSKSQMQNAQSSMLNH